MTRLRRRVWHWPLWLLIASAPGAIAQPDPQPPHTAIEVPTAIDVPARTPTAPIRSPIAISLRADRLVTYCLSMHCLLMHCLSMHGQPMGYCANPLAHPARMGAMPATTLNRAKRYRKTLASRYRWIFNPRAIDEASMTSYTQQTSTADRRQAVTLTSYNFDKL